MLTAVSLYAVWRAVCNRDFRCLFLFLAALAVGTSIAAIQLLPFAEYVADSATLAARLLADLSHGNPLRAGILYLLPFYFGRVDQETNWEDNYSYYYNEILGYVGLAPLILSVLGIAVHRDRKAVMFFLVLALCATWASFDIPVARSLQAILPIFSTIIHGRMNLVLGFGLATLGAFGLDAVRDPPVSRKRILTIVTVFMGLLLTAVVVLMTIFDLPSPMETNLARAFRIELVKFALTMTAVVLLIRSVIHGSRVGGHFLIGVQTLSLFLMAGTYYPVMRTSDFYPSTPALEYLQKNAGQARCLLPTANVAAMYNLRDANGYDGMNPGRICHLLGPSELLGWLGNYGVHFNDHMGDAVGDVLSLKYVLLNPGSPSPGAKYRLVYDGADGRVFLNTKALPRAMVVPSARLASDDEALRLVTTGGIDLMRTVLLAEPPPDDAVSKAVRWTGRPAPAPIIEDPTPNRVLIRVTAPGDAWLVLSDSWAPGWRVRIDGRPARLYRANYAFRAVRVAAGSHEVEFRYLPGSFILGAAMTVIGLMVSGWWIISGSDRPPSTA